jgi:hypothetical protein
VRGAYGLRHDLDARLGEGVGSSKVTGPPQAFHYKLRNPLTILGYFTWCLREERTSQ